MVEFIYTPVSGTRIFINNVNSNVGSGLVQYTNSSYHYVGNGVLLSYFAAEAGHYFRKELKNLLKNMDNVIILAWDNQGKISAIGRKEWAVEVDRLVKELAETKRKTIENTQISLIESGCVYPKVEVPGQYGRRTYCNLENEEIPVFFSKNTGELVRIGDLPVKKRVSRVFGFGMVRNDEIKNRCNEAIKNKEEFLAIEKKEELEIDKRYMSPSCEVNS